MNEILEIFTSPPLYASFLVFSVKSLFLLYFIFLYMEFVYYVIVHTMEACNEDYIIMSIALLDNLSSLRQKVKVIWIFLNKRINWKWYVEMEFNANISLGSVQATVIGRLRCRTPVPRRFDGICQYNKSTLILKNLSPQATAPYLFLTQIHHFSLVVYVCTKLALWNGVI